MNNSVLPFSRPRSVTALLRLMIIWSILCVPLPCSAGEADPNPDPKYPDIWYREYNARPEKVYDVFFSDVDIWADEPVVILHDLEKVRGRAVGFFTGKRREIYSDCIVDEEGSCLGYHYYYADSKREMARRYFPDYNDAGNVFTEDAGRLQTEEYATLGRGEIIDELFPEGIRKKLLDDTEEEIPHSVEDGRKIDEKRRVRLRRGEITYATVGNPYCEPLGSYLVKRNQSYGIVWAKSLVRFYPDRDRAPDHDNIRCDVEKIRISSEIYPRLLLRDGTALAIALEAVVRIRQEDGGAPGGVFPGTFRIFDAVDVIKAKLELMRKEAAVQKKCAEEGKDLWGDTPGCGLYRIETRKGFAIVLDEERLQLDLGKRLFNNEEFK